MYTKESITRTFRDVGDALNEPVTIYLVGGGALSLRGLKVATKDIDIVVLDRNKLDRLVEVFKFLGFKPAVHLDEEIYLSAVAVLVKEESRMDIFLREVCKKLKFSEAMQQRADDVAIFGNLTVKAASNEDIFLFKSLAVEADREHDIVDCASLFRKGLTWDIIVEECVAQHKEKTKWVFWLFEFICRFEDKEEVKVPIKGKVFQLCKENWQYRPRDFLYLIEDVGKHIKEVKYRREVQKVIKN